MMKQEKNPELPVVPHTPETVPAEPSKQIETPRPDIQPIKEPLPGKGPMEVPGKQ